MADNKMKKLISILFFFVPVFAFAHTGEGLSEHHNSMMNWSGWGWFGGFWMILGFAVAVLLVIVLILVILKLLKK